MNFLICFLVFVPIIAAQQCGRPSILGSRVISGHNARAGAWPWQALIKENGKPSCGGTLIAPHWVLSAAHCFKGKERKPYLFEVVMGDHHFNMNDGFEQKLRVKAIFVHHRFSFNHFDSDVALLRLQYPAQINKYVQTACLPNVNDQPPVGTECYITGFGKINRFGAMHPLLQQAKLPIVSNYECNRLNYANTRIRVTSSMLCAGHGGRTAVSGCHGDSGGPFVCRKRTGEWYVHGAVSWGSNSCSASQTYTVFARISYLRHWIDSTMQRIG